MPVNWMTSLGVEVMRELSQVYTSERLPEPTISDSDTVAEVLVSLRLKVVEPVTSMMPSSFLPSALIVQVPTGTSSRMKVLRRVLSL